jgi:hypothetical protein
MKQKSFFYSWVYHHFIVCLWCAALRSELFCLFSCYSSLTAFIVPSFCSLPPDFPTPVFVLLAWSAFLAAGPKNTPDFLLPCASAGSNFSRQDSVLPSRSWFSIFAGDFSSRCLWFSAPSLVPAFNFLRHRSCARPCLFILLQVVAWPLEPSSPAWSSQPPDLIFGFWFSLPVRQERQSSRCLFFVRSSWFNFCCRFLLGRCVRSTRLRGCCKSGILLVVWNCSMVAGSLQFYSWAVRLNAKFFSFFMSSHGGFFVTVTKCWWNVCEAVLMKCLWGCEKLYW